MVNEHFFIILAKVIITIWVVVFATVLIQAIRHKRKHKDKQNKGGSHIGNP